jgi:hypothetical protein
MQKWINNGIWEIGESLMTESKIMLNLEDWGTFEKIGKGYAFKESGKFYSILETKKGSYRGNHVHPNTQYTLLLQGKAKYILCEEGQYHEKPMSIGRVYSVDAGVPHIMVVDEDIITFEWWDGDFIAEPCDGEFDRYTAGKVGPEHYQA